MVTGIMAGKLPLPSMVALTNCIVEKQHACTNGWGGSPIRTQAICVHMMTPGLSDSLHFALLTVAMITPGPAL